MPNDYLKDLHELIRALIDIENRLINNRYEEAYAMLRPYCKYEINELIAELRAQITEKLYEIHGERNS
jgi:hypothetical protein